MADERLPLLSREELIDLARTEGLIVSPEADRGSVMELIADLQASFDDDADEFRSLHPVVTKYGTRVVAESTHPRDAVPQRYNLTSIVFLLRDVNWAFAYWDVDRARVRDIERDPRFNGLALRVYELDDDPAGDDRVRSYFDIPIQLEDDSWYIYLPHDDQTYAVDLIELVGSGFRRLARSNTIMTPRASDSGQRLSSTEQALELAEYADSDMAGVYSSMDAIPQRIISFYESDTLAARDS